MLKLCPLFHFHWILITLCLSNYRQTVKLKSLFTHRIFIHDTSVVVRAGEQITHCLQTFIYLSLRQAKMGERGRNSERRRETKIEVWDTFWHYIVSAKTFSLWELPRHEAWHHFWLHTDYKWRHTAYSVPLVHVCFYVVTLFNCCPC